MPYDQVRLYFSLKLDTTGNVFVQKNLKYDKLLLKYILAAVTHIYSSIFSLR